MSQETQALLSPVLTPYPMPVLHYLHTHNTLYCLMSLPLSTLPNRVAGSWARRRSMIDSKRTISINFGKASRPCIERTLLPELVSCSSPSSACRRTRGGTPALDMHMQRTVHAEILRSLKQRLKGESQMRLSSV